jgi:hypothetical protein
MQGIERSRRAFGHEPFQIWHRAGTRSVEHCQSAPSSPMKMTGAVCRLARTMRDLLRG